YEGDDALELARGDADSRRHSARETQHRDEVDAAVESRGDRDGRVVVHEAHFGPLLTQEEQERLVVRVGTDSARVADGEPRLDLEAPRELARVRFDRVELARGFADDPEEADVFAARSQVAHEQ